MTDTTADSPRYPGPLPLAQSLSALALASAADAKFTRDGPRADVEYRDLDSRPPRPGASASSTSARSRRCRRRRVGTGTT
jgi:hypothetical protein